MTYRLNGEKVSRKKFLASCKGFDYSSPATLQLMSEIQPYDCPVTGKIIDNKHKHKENLKKTGCRIFEKGEREHFQKNLVKTREETAERTADFLSDRIAERWDAPA